MRDLKQRSNPSLVGLYVDQKVPEATQGQQHPELKGRFSNELPLVEVNPRERGVYGTLAETKGFSLLWDSAQGSGRKMPMFSITDNK